MTEVGFSVIIAAYQAADSIEQAVQSALAQTLPAVQVIVCDDGSTDGTATLLRDRFGDAVIVVQQENRGALAARNAAASVATAEWLVVLDADDRFAPGRLEALAACVVGVAPDVDIVTTDALLELPDGTVFGRYYDTITFPTEDQPRRLLTGNFIFGAAAIRRSRFEAVGGYSAGRLDLSEAELWMRLVLTGSRVRLVAEPLYHYVQSSSALTVDRSATARHQMAALQMAIDANLVDGEYRAIAASEVTRLGSLVAAVEARAALLERRPGSRLAAFRAARGPGLRARQRASLLAMGALPSLAQRLWSTPRERQSISDAR
ncbi:MAG: glycosyltransferase [Ilumatobacteraceae bacterium]